MSTQHFVRYFLPASGLVAAGVAWLIARTDDWKLEGAYAVVGFVLSALVWKALTRACACVRRASGAAAPEDAPPDDDLDAVVDPRSQEKVGRGVRDARRGVPH